MEQESFQENNKNVIKFNKQQNAFKMESASHQKLQHQHTMVSSHGHRQLETSATAGAWKDSEKPTGLILALRGEALGSTSTFGV